jgi:hypothetical protein
MTQPQPEWIQELFETVDQGEKKNAPKLLYMALTLEPNYFTKAVSRFNQRLEVEPFTDVSELLTVYRQFCLSANPSEEYWSLAWNELIQTLQHMIDRPEAHQLLKEHVDLLDWWSSESLLSLPSSLTILDIAERIDALDQFSSYLPDIFANYALVTAKDEPFARLAWYALASNQQELLAPYRDRIEASSSKEIQSLRQADLVDHIETTRVVMLKSKDNEPIELTFERTWTL